MIKITADEANGIYEANNPQGQLLSDICRDIRKAALDGNPSLIFYLDKDLIERIIIDDIIGSLKAGLFEVNAVLDAEIPFLYISWNK